jgi:hypothetical protein
LYNPAGVADAGTSLLVDFSWLNFSSDYTRRTQVTGQTVGGEKEAFPEQGRAHCFVGVMIRQRDMRRADFFRR